MHPFNQQQMRRIFLMAVMCLFCMFMAANPISPTKVLNKARQIAGKRLAVQPTDIKIAHQHLRASGEPCLYVVNMGNRGGFLVLPGDDTSDMILCPESHLAPRIMVVRLWACGCYDPAAGVFNDCVPWGCTYS